MAERGGREGMCCSIPEGSSPENLLWDGENAVLTDLETVRFLNTTYVAGATGTYPYQAPEQIDRGVRQCPLEVTLVTAGEEGCRSLPFVIKKTGMTSAKADIWALGCVLVALALRPAYPDIMAAASLALHRK